ncbi:ribonuclease J [Candidatus Fokinia crypta]|uniref:Ribonuclease J n=1 Tax=Candidatus Fokinia crypta TaxID=1920990 RepID=A0ABZ0UN82_9RICK|nr:ribonuclease J [Candidatus Fokinia cryptica]WPX97583.1 Ribonuclease J [Candidatus Fokinia cryptica]
MYLDFSTGTFKKEFIIIPIGGVGEIGVNCTLYHYNGKWLMVDCGLGFAGDEFPGIDVMLPKPDFIDKIRDDLVGIVLTHAHEDHIGALQYLWEYMGFPPLYASEFTCLVLKSKFKEQEVAESKMDLIKKLNTGEEIKLSDFIVTPANVTHSIPMSMILFISCRVDGKDTTICHTGDWRIEETPLVGAKTDEDTIRKIAKNGIFAVVSDSTNVFNEQPLHSEVELQQSLREIIGSWKTGTIFIPTFASNISRMYSVAQIAKSLGKKMVLAGRSLIRMYEVALKCGYLKEFEPFILAEDASKYKRDELIVLCTGCQGERFAVITAIAGQFHPHLDIFKDDLVVFSSKRIPGNEKKIDGVINQLIEKGVTVFTEKSHFVHVSGHPSREEMRWLYTTLNFPRLVIPVHGEISHMSLHKEFVQDVNPEMASVLLKCGQVISLNPKAKNKEELMHTLGDVESGYLAVDGKNLISSDSIVIKDRKVMMENGLVVVLLFLNSNNRIARRPYILAPGLLDMSVQEDTKIVSSLVAVVRDVVEDSFKSGVASVIKPVAKHVAKFCKKELGKAPKIVVHIENL